MMAARRKKRSAKKRLIVRLRKPMAPPARVEENPKAYDRKRERERTRRQAQLEQSESETIGKQ
jgi:hypothetical protein